MHISFEVHALPDTDNYSGQGRVVSAFLEKKKSDPRQRALFFVSGDRLVNIVELGSGAAPEHAPPEPAMVYTHISHLLLDLEDMRVLLVTS